MHTSDSENDAKYFEELTRLNNELVNVQRALAKKQEELRQANDQLEATVQLRTAQLAVSNEQLARTNAKLVEALAAAQTANSAKSEFLSHISHELLTPLNAILGFGQILESRDLGEVENESVAHILKGGHRLHDLIKEIMDISCAHNGTPLE
jgi:signal transduction histidine kinase